MSLDDPIRDLPRRTSIYKWLAWGVLVAGVASSIWGWNEAGERARQASDADLDEFGGRAAVVIEERFGRYLDLMTSFQSVFHSKPGLTRREFHQHFVSMNVVSRYPGAQAIVYAPLIQAERIAELQAAARSDTTLRAEGYPDYTVKRPGDQTELLPVLYCEPLGGNEEALGTDLWSDARRRLVGARMRDTGVMSLSAPSALADGHVVISLDLPVYRSGAYPRNDQQRKESHAGQIKGTFHAMNFMQDVLPADLRAYRVRITDIGSIEAVPDEQASPVVLYDSKSRVLEFVSPGADDVREHILPLGGRLWAVKVARTQVNFHWETVPVSILMGGIIASCALFLVLSSLANRYQEAARIAHEMSREARSAAARLKSLIDSTADGIVTIDASGRVTSANPAVLHLLGAEVAEVMDRPLSDFVQEGDRLLQELVESDSAVHETTAKSMSGGAVPVDVSFSAMMLDGRREVVAILRDASERRKSEARILHMAHHDALTGLPNRALLLDRLKVAIDRARREDQQMAVLFVDLDHFKEINDTLGHEAGDAVLREVASRLRTAVRASDTVARMGGDEFVVMLPSITAAEGCDSVAQKMLAALAAPVLIGAREVRMTPSIGGAVFPDDADSVERLLRRADAAMYQAKLEGRNAFRRYRRPPDGDSMMAPLAEA